MGFAVGESLAPLFDVRGQASDLRPFCRIRWPQPHVKTGAVSYLLIKMVKFTSTKVSEKLKLGVPSVFAKKMLAHWTKSALTL